MENKIDVKKVLAKWKKGGKRFFENSLVIGFRSKSVRLICIGIPMIALILYAVWHIPKMQLSSYKNTVSIDEKEYIQLEDQYRKTLIQMIGGSVVLIGLYLTYRRIRASEESQITERFTRAIDQLGATDENGKARIEIRLGGIYALERIAKDSKKDHWTIMEIFKAYVKKNAPYQAGSKTEKNQNRNLSEANLQGANLREVKLQGAIDITADQLCDAKTLYGAKLDPELEQQVKEKCPHLLTEESLK